MSILRRWIVSAVLVSLLILALGWYSGVAPALERIRLADAERVSVESVNARYEAVLLRLTELAADRPALENRLDQARAEIPARTELSPYLGQLNARAQATGVTLTEVVANTPELVNATFLEGTAVADLVAVPVQISAAGTPDNLARFLKQVQFGTRLLLVSRFSLTDESGNGSVRLEGYIFVLPEEGAALPSAEDVDLDPAEPEPAP